jgi:dCTP deaminase
MNIESDWRRVMPLGAAELVTRLWDGKKKINPAQSLCVVPLLDSETLKKHNGASLDLRLGRWFRTMQQTKVTSIKIGGESRNESISKEHYIRFNDYFVLHPGQFVIGITLEWLKLPFNLSAYVTGKSAWGRRGLIIETAAGIHPGFTGCLTLELANVGAAPIELNPGMQICQIFFHHVKKSKAGATTQFVGYRKPVLGHVRKDMVASALADSYFDSGSS